MKTLKNLGIAAMMFLAACSSSSGTPDDPDPVITYLLQILTAPPATATVNATVPIAFTLLQQTDGGPTSPASDRTITFTVTAGGGTVNSAASTTITTGANGVVSLSWKLGATPGVQTLQATATGITPIDVSLTATPLPATQLAITTQPATQVITGGTLSRQPVLQLRNADGGPVAQAGVTVGASIASGAATLGGTNSVVTDANGNATFTNLSVTGTGNVTLSFTATLEGVAVTITSQAIAVIPPNQLALTTVPTGLVTAVPFFQQPVIQLQDGLGAAIHQAGVVVTISSSSPTAVIGVAAGGTGSLTATTDANGVATFHDVMLTGSGSTTLGFTATGFTTVSSASLAMNASPAIVSLGNGPASAAVSGIAGTLTYYTFTAPTGTFDLSFATLDGTGNTELYVRRGAWPTASDFTCRDQVAGMTHICDIPTNRDGPWFVIVRGAATFTGATIRGFAYGPNCVPRALVVGAATAGGITASSCTVNAVPRPMERFTMTLATPTAIRFGITSPTFGLLLSFKRLGEPRIYFLFNPGTSTTSTQLFPAGTYEVEVIDNYYTVPVFPTYTLTATAVVPPAPTGCNFMTAHTTGLSIGLTLATDCAGTTAGTWSHRILVLLGPGQSLNVSAASAAFDPYIKIMAGQISTTAPILAEDDNGGGGTTARILFTNPGALGFFTVEVSSKNIGGVGAYTFTFDATGNYFNSMPMSLVKKP